MGVSLRVHLLASHLRLSRGKNFLVEGGAQETHVRITKERVEAPLKLSQAMHEEIAPLGEGDVIRLSFAQVIIRSGKDRLVQRGKDQLSGSMQRRQQILHRKPARVLLLCRKHDARRQREH